MGSLFRNTKNTRLLPVASLKYIRSDVPTYLDEKEIQWLLENNVRTIVDLRTPAEMEQKPCPLVDRSDFHYYNMPITGGNTIPNEPCKVADSYFAMADDAMWKTIEFMEHSQTNVLYFCSPGKDRTGVVSALLLSRMHVCKKTIVEDYLASASNLSDRLKAYVSQNPSIHIEVITPHAAYMEEFLDRFA